jgi:hypothetical protein
LPNEYKDVGKDSFLPRLLPGVGQPCPDFPSIKWTGAKANAYYMGEMVSQRVIIE